MNNYNLIVARSRNNIIGDPNGNIPWYLPDDFKWFKEQTLNHTVVMGRKTLESIGRFLPNRHNVILTRNPNDLLQNEIFLKKTENLNEKTTYEVLSDLNYLSQHGDDVFIIGGGEIYKYALDNIKTINKLYITEVHTDIKEESGCAHFNYDDDNFSTIYSHFHEIDDKHNYEFTFKILKSEH